MDPAALTVSLRLGVLTVLILPPIGIALGRLLAFRAFEGKGLAEAALALPLVLPPTITAFSPLVAFGASSPFAPCFVAPFGSLLSFSFARTRVHSVIFHP